MNQNDFIPDFSGDDFANDPEIKKSREAQEAHDQMIGDCVALLMNELSAKPSSHKNLKSFYTFKDINTPFINQSLRSDSPFLPLHISVVSYRSSIAAGKVHSSGTDEYLFGVLSLRETYPRTLIFRENVREKITDWFTKSDLDFFHAKKFSRRFHVITENKERLSALWRNKELDPLAHFPDMEAELNENLCLFRASRRCLSLEETDKFCQLAKTVSELMR